MTDHQQFIQDLRHARRRWQEDPSEENEREVARLYKLAHPKTQRQSRLRGKRWHKEDKAKWQGVIEKYGNQCVCCGADGGEDGMLLVIDHVIPLSKGGKDNMNNIQPLCAECNSRKGTSSADFRPQWPLQKEVMSKIM
jgi:5-methylcytosine-specific restriction endonuclease McrA